jgi:hypothetical protein
LLKLPTKVLWPVEIGVDIIVAELNRANAANGSRSSPRAYSQGRLRYQRNEVPRREKGGRIALASGGGSHGEGVRRTRDANDAVKEVWLAATRFVPEAQAAAETESRYAA